MRKFSFLLLMAAMAGTGCSTGDLRAFNDAMAGSNGRKVVYHDQQYTEYAGDIKLIHGVRRGKGFFKLKNTDSNYCKVKVKFENGNARTYRLRPNKSTGRKYMSVYNQVKSFRSKCHRTKRVFDASFN